MTTLCPAAAPCRSCPYRRDVPSGVWDETEYAKLPPYDQPTPYQPSQVFLCHQQDGRICAGWAGCHDMSQSLALRLQVASSGIEPEDLEATLDYESPVPLFASGAEAAKHGLAQVEQPPPEAVKTIDRLARKLTAQ